jgi:hypothetical protein
MRNSKFFPFSMLALAALLLADDAAKPAVLYSNDFEKVAVGEEPADVIILDGQFAVRQREGNRVLELPGEPLGSFGLVFGPNRAENVTVGGRFLGSTKSRVSPQFGVGLLGATGFRLQVSPGDDAVQLLSDGQPIASAPFKWAGGKWTRVKLSITKSGDKRWTLIGKAWRDGEAEPEKPTVEKSLAELPAAGAASAWATPLSGKPIELDDLLYTAP